MTSLFLFFAFFLFPPSLLLLSLFLKTWAEVGASPLSSHLKFVAAGGSCVAVPPVPADYPVPVGASAALHFAPAAPFPILVLGSVCWPYCW